MFPRPLNMQLRRQPVRVVLRGAKLLSNRNHRKSDHFRTPQWSEFGGRVWYAERGLPDGQLRFKKCSLINQNREILL
jgi:hypothetical protein